MFSLIFLVCYQGKTNSSSVEAGSEAFCIETPGLSSLQGILLRMRQALDSLGFLILGRFFKVSFGRFCSCIAMLKCRDTFWHFKFADFKLFLDHDSAPVVLIADGNVCWLSDNKMMHKTWSSPPNFPRLPASRQPVLTFLYFYAHFCIESLCVHLEFGFIVCFSNWRRLIP